MYDEMGKAACVGVFPGELLKYGGEVVVTYCTSIQYSLYIPWYFGKIPCCWKRLKILHLY